MRDFTHKMWLFLFLACLFGKRTELSVLIAAVTGTVLLWPIYRSWLIPLAGKRPRRDRIERPDPNLIPAGQRMDEESDAL